MVKLSVLLTTLCLQLAYGWVLPGDDTRSYEDKRDKRKSSSEDLSNAVEILGEGNYNYKPAPSSNEFVKIIQFPTTDYNKLVGEHVELFCEASGTPPPVIQWYKGNRKVTLNQMNFEDNTINPSTSGYAKVASRLVINYVLPRHQDVYSCEASNKYKKVSRKMFLNVPNGQGREMNLTELIALKIVGSYHKPRVTFWAPSYLGNIGTDVVLPCKSVGNPIPDLTWVDEDNNRFTKDEPAGRFQVTSAGELSIRSLQWEDMGVYTCIVQNREGDDSVETFLYPMDPSK